MIYHVIRNRPKMTVRHIAGGAFKWGGIVVGELDLRFYFWILKRRLPYLTAFVVLAVAIAVVIALALPRAYVSTGRILVESPQIPSELARSTVPTNVFEQLKITQQQITTRDGLVELADKLGIYGNERAMLSGEDIAKDMRSRISFEQVLWDAPQGGPGATVFSVSFKANEPLLAAKVANELVGMILRRNQRQRTDRAGDTYRFFNQEVMRLGADLNRLEADILKFKNENKDTLPDSLDFRRTRQISQQERLVSLEHEEADLRSRRGNLVATYAATGQIASADPLTPEQQTLMDMNRALAEQLTTFSPSSPNIVALRARIASLEDGLKLTDTAKADGAKDKRNISALDVQLSDIDERLQLIAREKSAITRNIAELTRSITLTPESETVLNSLERNQLNLQTQYNAAIARRAEALIGEQIEMRSDGGRFSLLEPAIPPESAVSPQRRLIVAIGAVAGVGLGLGVIVLLELLNRTIRRPSELAQMLEYQPLATIPHILAPSDVVAANKSRGLAVLLFSSAIPISLMVIHYYFRPLGPAFQALVSRMTASW